MPLHPRSDWTELAAPGEPIAAPAEWVIHHFWRPDVPATASLVDERRIIAAVDRAHRDNGWGGIAYGHLIGDSGRVWEGRGWRRSGAHAAGRRPGGGPKINYSSHSVAFMIDADRDFPTAKAWAALAELLEHGEREGHVQRGSVISPHRRYAAKSCPGHAITDRHLDDLRRWLDNPEVPDVTAEEHAWLATIHHHVAGDADQGARLPRLIRDVDELSERVAAIEGG